LIFKGKSSHGVELSCITDEATLRLKVIRWFIDRFPACKAKSSGIISAVFMFIDEIAGGEE
jgi:hypothetical protein